MSGAVKVSKDAQSLGLKLKLLPMRRMDDELDTIADTIA